MKQRLFQDHSALNCLWPFGRSLLIAPQTSPLHVAHKLKKLYEKQDIVKESKVYLVTYKIWLSQ